MRSAPKRAKKEAQNQIYHFIKKIRICTILDLIYILVLKSTLVKFYIF